MQDRKYFGISRRQLGILAGMAVVACLLFGVTGLLALRNGSNLFSRSPEPTAIIQPSPTRLISPTAAITETPTPIPYEQLIPYGWIQHKTQLIELWVPPEFTSAVAGEVSGVSGSSVYLNLALISTSSKSSYSTSVSVSYEPLTSDSLKEFLDARLSNIPPGVNRVEHRTVSINATEAVRLMFESQADNNLNINDLLFVFQDGSTVWYVKYSAEIAEFYEMLPFFEESIKTFRVVK
jgi:hypothetical protein